MGIIHPTALREPPIIILPPSPLATNPATLIFLHGYDSTASRFNRLTPPNSESVSHHIHTVRSLQHLKIIIPNGLPCIHPSVKRNVWYNLDIPFPKPGDANRAHEAVEYGTSERNEDDMKVTMDYITSLIEREISSGTPASRIVLMGYSQGGTIATLFLLTRKLGASLGAVISYAGFPPTPMTSVARMQKENNLEGKWSKETILFLLHGSKDVFVPREIYYAWLDRLEGFKERGQGFASIEGKMIDGGAGEGMGHRVTDGLWPVTTGILEGIVPTSSGTAHSKL